MLLPEAMLVSVVLLWPEAVVMSVASAASKAQGGVCGTRCSAVAEGGVDARVPCRHRKPC